METYTGLEVNPLNLRLRDIRIEDIAHSLALQCRYGGHCKYFYSIAQHSILVSKQLNGLPLRLFGLLHDAAEAYLGDMISPMKQVLPQFKIQEESVQSRILARFCPQRPTFIESQRIKDADTRLLLSEAWFLMPSRGIGWREDVSPVGFCPDFWTSEDAEQLFLQEFFYLQKRGIK